ACVRSASRVVFVPRPNTRRDGPIVLSALLDLTRFRGHSDPFGGKGVHCSALPRSSHPLKVARPLLARAGKADRLARARDVVPTHPASDCAARLDEAREAVLPDALLLEAPEEPLDHAVLLRRVRRDEFLTEAIVLARCPEAPALEDESVVAAQ